MDTASRKAAVADYKRQPTLAGVYAVICTATGQTWVGKSRHIDTEQNGLWFALRLGSCPFRSLQSVWKEHPHEDFRFEERDIL